MHGTIGPFTLGPNPEPKPRIIATHKVHGNLMDSDYV